MQKHERLDTSALDEHLRVLGSDGEAAALSALCAAAKSQRARDYIQSGIDADKLQNALQKGAPKARKNAARLMGALGDRAYEAPLLLALEREETRFVRPSILLALGHVGSERARNALSALPPVRADTAQEEKHALEESEALRRALASLTPRDQHAFEGFARPTEVTLCCPEGFEGFLIGELNELGIKGQALPSGGVSVLTPDYAALFRARCFFEALIPLGKALSTAPDQAAERVKTPLLSLMEAAHAGEPPYTYRVEYKGGGDRADFISRLVNALDSGALINNPSGYEAELRLIPRDEGVDAYCKLYAFKDTRFAYRVRALPASIHPAMAASIARLARSLAPEAKRVLDPCCGSGTLLIEYGKLKGDAELTGMDINEASLALARENIATAGLRAGLVHQDLIRFEARRPYELVLANLPFGNRVGNHKENEALYAALASKLTDWLAPGGVAILYTMEYSLLRRSIAPYKELVFIRKLRTLAGGLQPQVIALQRLEVRA